MTRPFAALERFFERLFERPAARLFRTRLQPVQLQRRLERAMEADRRHSADRTYVPNSYRVLLHPEDHAAFSSYQATLETDLSAALLQRARSRGYTLVERPRVTILPTAGVPRSDIQVVAELLDPRLARAPEPRPERHDDGVAAPMGGAAMPPGVTRTAVFNVPTPPSVRAVLEVHSPGVPPRSIPLTGGSVRIGRSSDNDLVLPDDRVSRHHGQLTSRQGALVYTDLGSTNGSYLNGAPVSEIALGPGDVLQVGDSVLSILPGG